ncbi:PEGA domain-containing protein [Spirochaetia bacterium 38H-sp]|uniref:PEGA domain-containing protein n=1 Tax=Rarispira pelagica TaxID=3141764 RepID=A0ABU9UFY5_9SPIR
MKKFFYVLIIFCFSFFLFCEEIPVPKEWKFAATPFTAKNDSAVSISASFPLLVMEKLSDIGVHILSKEEIKAYNEYQRKEIINKLSDSLNAKLAERDELLFSSDFFSRWNDRVKKNREIEEIRKKITDVDLLQDVNLDKVNMVLYKDNDSLPFLDTSSGIRKAMENNGVVFLISGQITVDEQYAVIDVSLYHFYLDSYIFSKRYAKKLEELDYLADDVAYDIASVFLGAVPASIRIKTDKNTAIYIDDKAVGIGEAYLYFLIPGQHRLALEARNKKRLVRDVVLKEGENTDIELIIEDESRRTIRIVSNPEAASVFVDGIFYGKTPCNVDVYSSSVIELRKDGYSSIYLSAANLGDKIDISFANPNIDWQKRVIEKRNKFYTSFGLFFLSLPVTVISYGLWEDSYTAYHAANQSLASNADDYYSKMNYAAGAYYGGLFLNTAFFVMTVYNLNDYLKSLDKL